MNEVGLTGKTELPRMYFRREDIGLFEKLSVCMRIIGSQPFQDIIKSQHLNPILLVTIRKFKGVVVVNPVRTCSNSLGCDPWTSTGKGTEEFQKVLTLGEIESIMTLLSFRKGISMKKYLIGILLIAAIAALLYYFFRRNQEEENPSIKVSGNIEATEVDVGFKV